MPLWLLEPAASPEDGRWQGRDIWRRVIVDAPTPAQARLAAEHWALGGVSPEMANDNLNAGFADDKLYFVRSAPEEVVASSEESARGSRVVAADRLT